MLLSSEAKLVVTLVLVLGLVYVLNSKTKPVANKGVVNTSSSSLSVKTPRTVSTPTSNNTKSTAATSKQTASTKAAAKPAAKPAAKEATKPATKPTSKNFNVSDYLPQEVNKKWFETDFSVAKNKVDKKNLIITNKYMVGVNTVGQSRGNANYDLRQAPANPKITVSPWLQSTIEYDYNQKPLM